MKILMPCHIQNNCKVDSDLIIGGIEKFAKHVYQNFDNIIPVYFTTEDQRNRKITDIIVNAVNEHNPDIILNNHELMATNYAVQKRVDIPMAWFSHMPVGGICRLAEVKAMNSSIIRGNSVFMVSEFQYNGMNLLSKRIQNQELKIAGYISPSYCEGSEVVNTKIKYDCATIGRFDKIKDPFWIHRKSKDIGVKSLVITSIVKEYMKNNQEYYDKNVNWASPQEVLINLKHQDVLNEMSASMCYVSTWSHETFGITVLEALSRGLPCILRCAKENSHASEIIAASPSHLYKVPSKISPEEFKELLNRMSKISLDEKNEISEMTKEKHSIGKWKMTIQNALNKTIEIFNSRKQKNILDFT